MTGSPPEASPAKILVRLDDATLARWVLWLVEALEQRPATEVFVRIREPGTRDGGSALATLLSLERMLLRRNRAGGADRIARGEFGGKRTEPPGFKPDIIIDLGDEGLLVPQSEAICLRPLYDGNPGETALASALFFRGTPAISIERIMSGDEMPSTRMPPCRATTTSGAVDIPTTSANARHMRSSAPLSNVGPVSIIYVPSRRVVPCSAATAWTSRPSSAS